MDLLDVLEVVRELLSGGDNNIQHQRNERDKTENMDTRNDFVVGAKVVDKIPANSGCLNVR